VPWSSISLISVLDLLTDATQQKMNWLNLISALKNTLRKCEQHICASCSCSHRSQHDTGHETMYQHLVSPDSEQTVGSLLHILEKVRDFINCSFFSHIYSALQRSALVVALSLALYFSSSVGSSTLTLVPSLFTNHRLTPVEDY